MSNLQSYFGKPKTFLHTITDQGARVDLSGKTLRFVAKVSREDPGASLVDKSTGSGITNLDQTQAATKGQATTAILAADTNATSKINPARSTVLEFDLELDGVIVDSGDWQIDPSVRRY